MSLVIIKVKSGLHYVGVFGPVFITLLLTLFQTIIILLQKRSIYRNNRKKKDGIIIDERFDPMQPEVWFDDTMWDDIVCGIAMASIMLGLCMVGATNVAWFILSPMLALGWISITNDMIHSINLV